LARNGAKGDQKNIHQIDELAAKALFIKGKKMKVEKELLDD
jgi:hypothetical protein